MRHPAAVRSAVLVAVAVALCAVSGCSAPHTGGAEGVTAARIVWHLPGAAAPIPPSTLDQEQARALLGAINAAPVWPSGRYNCPEDDGSTATITFLRSGRTLTRVTARLTGCGSIDGREMTASVATLLRRSGPSGLRVFSHD